MLPKQGHWVGKRVRVRVYKSDVTHYGFVVRNDIAGSFHTIVKLDDGTLIMGTECDFSAV